MKLVHLVANSISRLNLWTRLVAVLTIGFVTLFGVFSLVSLRVLDDSTQRILTERQVIAQMASRRYDELLTQAYYELEKATTFAAFDPSASNLSNENHMLAHAYGRLGSFSLGVVFLDPRGQVVLSEPEDAHVPGSDYSVYPFISQVIQTRQRNISSPFRDSRTGKRAVAVTVPVFDEQHKFLSILSGWIDLSGPLMLTAVEQAQSLGETGHAELVDDQGTVIESTEGGWRTLDPGEHRSFYLRMLATEQGGVESTPEEFGSHVGSRHVMAFAPLTVTRWGVAVGGTEAETFAPVRQLESSIFILGTVSFVVIFLATLWGARLLVHPVKVLTAAAEEIAAGNLKNSIRLSEGGEIGVLAEAFEIMRKRLKHSVEEIQAWSTELETRVRQRTQELETLNVQLQREERERRQLLERVITAQEEERKRVARELHDETGQALTSLLMSLDALDAHLEELPPLLRDRLIRAKTLNQKALQGLRAMIYDLRPAALDDLGLIPAIRWYADQHLEPLGVHVAMETHPWETRLPATVETVLFRVLQEAINNIARHAYAHRVHITLEPNENGIRARLEDDGQGFDLSRLDNGWGLIGMRERANLIGGHVAVNSSLGGGTRIEVWIPLNGQGGADGQNSNSARG